MNKNYKNLVVAVIGLGVGAFHLKNCKKYKKCKIKYVCDLDIKKAEFYKRKFNVELCTNNINQVLMDDEVNAVIIASYDNFHAEQILKCLKKNKHVFVEKPMCLSFSELKKIKKIKQDKKKLVLYSNLVLRNHPFFKKLINTNSSKSFENAYFLEGDYNYGRLNKLTSGWRGKISNYSVMLGGGIHLIDLILKIKKRYKVKKIITLGNKLVTKKFKKFKDDFCISLIQFSDGSIAKITANFSSASDHHHVFKIFTNKFSLFYSRDESYKFFRENTSKGKIGTKYLYDNDDKALVLYDFFDSIINKKNMKEYENSLFHLMKICLLIDQGLKNKKIINL